jgi:hypothetical protein
MKLSSKSSTTTLFAVNRTIGSLGCVIACRPATAAGVPLAPLTVTSRRGPPGV